MTKFKRKKTYVIISIVCAVGTVAVISGFIKFENDRAKGISGSVTGISNECAFDGICSITVDDKVIITECTMTGSYCPRITVPQLSVGDRVYATALKESGSNFYSLDCSSCNISKL